MDGYYAWMIVATAFVLMMTTPALALFYGGLQIAPGPGRIDAIALPPPSVTGMYLTDPSSALFTNVFVGTPRTYGLTVGAHF